MVKRSVPRTEKTKGDAAPGMVGAVYQFKVTLGDIEPPIWRRLLVPADITLAELHGVLQVSMGWTNSHLHQFLLGDESYGVPDPDGPVEVHDERKARLGGLVAAGDGFFYEYDFGDGWQHEIVVEKSAPPEKGVPYPVCVGGERACPPEDCGGSYGYQNLIEALADPKHDEHEELKEWVGGSFDVEAFDVREVNAALARFAKRRAPGRR
jgi:hypothetical protein